MGGGAGRGGSKKSKPITASPRGAGLKSHPILPPPPPNKHICGTGKIHLGQKGEGRIKQSGTKLSSLGAVLGWRHFSLSLISQV